MFVAAKVWLSRQNVCFFVATNTCLSRQADFCHDQTFVATKMVLAVAPANGSFHRLAVVQVSFCIISGNCHKYNFCSVKHAFVTTKHLSGQKMVLVADPANDSFEA